MQMTIRTCTSITKQEIEFQYGGRPFSETEIVLFQPWIETCYRNLAGK